MVGGVDGTAFGSDGVGIVVAVAVAVVVVVEGAVLSATGATVVGASGSSAEVEILRGDDDCFLGDGVFIVIAGRDMAELGE